MIMQQGYHTPFDDSMRQQYHAFQDPNAAVQRSQQSYYDQSSAYDGFQAGLAPHTVPPPRLPLSIPTGTGGGHGSADAFSFHRTNPYSAASPPGVHGNITNTRPLHASHYSLAGHYSGFAGTVPQTLESNSQETSRSPTGSANDKSYYNGTPSISSNQSPPSSTSKSSATASNAKAVVRAACLSCRSAKRRCDGGQPVCGPCFARGVTEESGGCQYVASKRGGPRFKGCTGEEARRIKADKERQKLEQVRKMSLSPEPASLSRSNHSHRHSQTSQGDDLFHGALPPSLGPSHPQRSGSTGDSFGTYESGPTFRHFSSNGTVSHVGTSPDYLLSSSEAPVSTHLHHQAYQPPFVSLSHQLPQESQGQPQQRTDLASEQQSALDFLQQLHTSTVASEGTVGIGLPRDGDTWQVDSQSIDEFANHALGPEDNIRGFGGFYSRLEMLPKAGAPDINGQGGQETSAINFDAPLSFDADLEPHLLDAADSEQQARFLLTAFFDKVYPSAPVLLAPENLSSLAFWFSGKGPCALYAAISALVTLRLPEGEAQRTLRGGYHKTAGEEAKEGYTKAEIAAHHARVSDFLLKRFSQQQAAAAAVSFGLDPNALSTGCDPDETGRSLCQGPSDPELLRIEAAAAHTLLAHYFYGAGGKAGQRKAHTHALEAWGSLQGIRIELQEGVPPKDPLTTSHFNWEQKQEWAKRVYWTSYAASAVTAATGGFRPITFTLDAVAALKLRPALESDVGAWGVYIRGAQHVARGYAALYELETLKARKDLPHGDVAREKAKIFQTFSKLDQDMTAFCTYDPAWRSPTNPTSGLGFALRTAGKLMTAGAMIIIHRGQAYANAHIFMHTQCGLPEAARSQRDSSPMLRAPESFTHSQDSSDGFASNGGHNGTTSDKAVVGEAEEEAGSPSDVYVPPDRLWHRSGSTSLPPAGSGSGSLNAAPPGSTGGALEPSVAALDATFIGWGSSPRHSAPSPSASSPSQPYEWPTKTAMLAFQQFQAQQHVQKLSTRHGHRDARGGSSPSSAGGLHDLGSLGLGLGGGGGGSSATMTPPIPPTELTHERYKFGPFEPEHSASKCRWAARSMLESVPPLLHGIEGQDGELRDVVGSPLSTAPALPPWAACSYVLACYCLLMQCLITQSSRVWRVGAAIGGSGDRFTAATAAKHKEVDRELEVLRGQVIAIHSLLARFAQTINVAKEYQQEVAVLLQINRRLA